MASSSATITMKDVKQFAQIVEKRKKTTTLEEAKARLIASGALDENGKPRIYPKVTGPRRSR